MKLNIFLTTILFILFCTTVFSENFYANITFDITALGETTITGITNYQELTPKTTQELTSKTGKVWTFFADSNNTIGDYSYKVNLPQGATIQQIETTSTYFIQTQNNQIIIEGYGEQIPFLLKITYTLNQQPSQTDLLPIGVTLIILVAIIGAIYVNKNNKKDKQSDSEGFDKDTLTERQLLITKELAKRQGKCTQSDLQKILNLPKASMFRNITSLEKKGIIKKERKGMTMLLTLQKKEKN